MFGEAALVIGAREIVRALALFAIINEMVLLGGRWKGGEGFWIKPGPEEGEVADVPVDFPTRPPRSIFRLDEHFRDFDEAAAFGITNSVDRVETHEAAK